MTNIIIMTSYENQIIYTWNPITLAIKIKHTNIVFCVSFGVWMKFVYSNTEFIIASPHRKLSGKWITSTMTHFYKYKRCGIQKVRSLIPTSNMRSSIWEKYRSAAIILANKHTSLVTSGVTLGFPAVHNGTAHEKWNPKKKKLQNIISTYEPPSAIVCEWGSLINNESLFRRKAHE